MFYFQLALPLHLFKPESLDRDFSHETLSLTLDYRMTKQILLFMLGVVFCSTD